MKNTIIEKSKFWNSIRRLTRSDQSVEVEASLTNRVKTIFQPIKPVRFLVLQPAWGGSVRQAVSQDKFLYQTDDGFMVQLETNSSKQGWQLCGSLLDTQHPCNVNLFGQGILREKISVEDRFQFDDLAPGSYRICFEQEGVTFWIKSLVIGKEPQAPKPV